MSRFNGTVCLVILADAVRRYSQGGAARLIRSRCVAHGQAAVLALPQNQQISF